MIYLQASVSVSIIPLDSLYPPAYLESAVNSAVQADANGQQENGEDSIASRERDDREANRRSKLADRVEDFSGGAYATLFSGDKPVGYH